eukprot:Lankesteria_metandrocarpae@DN864_c0_g1_i1.p1
MNTSRSRLPCRSPSECEELSTMSSLRTHSSTRSRKEIDSDQKAAAKSNMVAERVHDETDGTYSIGIDISTKPEQKLLKNYHEGRWANDTSTLRRTVTDKICISPVHPRHVSWNVRSVDAATAMQDCDTLALARAPKASEQQTPLTQSYGSAETPRSPFTPRFFKQCSEGCHSAGQGGNKSCDYGVDNELDRLQNLLDPSRSRCGGSTSPFSLFKTQDSYRSAASDIVDSCDEDESDDEIRRLKWKFDVINSFERKKLVMATTAVAHNPNIVAGTVGGGTVCSSSGTMSNINAEVDPSAYTATDN